jgi:hypothetical protein
MQKKLLVVMGLLLSIMSIHAQEESPEQKRLKEAEKKLIEAKANHQKNISEARRKMGESWAEAIANHEKNISEARRKIGAERAETLLSAGVGLKYPGLDSSPQKREGIYLNDQYKEVSYAIPFAKGVLVLNFAPDSIEGYDGNEIVLKSWVEKEEEAAIDGLVLVSGNGLADNTSLGLFVDKKGESDSVVINELDMQGISGVKVMVPKAVKILVKYNSTYQNEQITFLNIKSELEVAVRFNPIIIKNITGAATVNSMYGSIVAQFEAPPSMPVSLISSYGNVDVTIPPISKVDLHVKTSWGKIYIAQSLVGKVQKDADSKESREQLKGKLNGGGTPFILSSGWGKIYLRLK